MHLVNRVLSAVLALALVVAAVLVPVEVVRALLGRRPWVVPYSTWAQQLRDLTWDASVTRAVCIGVAVVGLLLLLSAVRRGKPSALALTPLSPGVDAGTTRRSLQQTLQRAALGVDGVSSASATVKRRAARVTASSSLPVTGLSDQVQSAVRQRLDALGLASPLRLKVNVSSPKERS